MDVYRSVRCSLLLLPWLTHLLLADVLLSALLPVSAILPDTAYNISSRLAESVWRGIQYIFVRYNRADVVLSGADKIPRGESAIVIANHVEWTDFYMIQELAIKAGMLSRCRWFAKQQLKWVPFLGWGLWAMGMPLVSRKWTEDQREMDRVFRGVTERHWPMCTYLAESNSVSPSIFVGLISYSEATRYTARKRLEAEAWCRQNNKSLGDHVLYPRTKGFIACVQKLRQAPHVKAVYDVTIGYRNKQERTFQKPPTFLQTISNPRLDKDWQFYVHVDRHLLSQLPKDDSELAKWLEDRWVEKGRRLEELNVQALKGQQWT